MVAASEPRLAALTYLAGGALCHQRPERSFHVAGAQLPVCARCAALYSSAAVGMLAWVLVRGRRERQPVDPRRALGWLLAAAAPAVLSVAASSSGLWDGSNVTRAAMSLPLGVALGLVTSAVVARDLR